MKKNVPSDDLEAFLKNAFEEYAESPSEEVWDRIAATKTSAPRTPFRIFRIYPLWIGLAVALLAGFIIYQSVQVNKELEQINHSVKKQQVEIETLQKQEKRGIDTPKSLKESPQAGVEHEKMNNEGSNNEKNEVNDKEVNRLEAYKNEQQASSPAISTDKRLATAENTREKHAKTSTHPAKKGSILKNNANLTVEKQVNTNNSITQSSSETIYPFSNIPTVGETSTEALPPAVANVNTIKNSLFELNRLTSATQFLQTTQDQIAIQIPAALPPPTQPIQQKNGFYIGIQALAMKTQSRISSKAPYPLPPRDRKAFNQPDEAKGSTFAFGVNAGVGIAKNLSFETGLLYRSSLLTTTHEPKFKYNERKTPPIGGNPRDCQFEYDLNTPSGTVALAITVEKNVSSNPRDEEEITLKINSEQSLQYLSVPLLLNYQIGNGKLHLNAKGGTLLNFLLENDFNITGVASNNNNFRPQNNQPLRGELLYFNQLSLDYLLQFGIAYDVTRNLSVHLDPMLVGSITNQSSNRFIQSSNASVGVSAGVTWSF